MWNCAKFLESSLRLYEKSGFFFFHPFEQFVDTGYRCWFSNKWTEYSVQLKSIGDLQKMIIIQPILLKLG